MAKTLKALDQKLNELQAIKDKELSTLQAKLDVTEETIRTTTEAINKARADADEETFMKASKERESAQEIARMYQDKMKKVEAKPLVNESEYLELKKEIIDSLDNVVRESYKKLLPVIAEIENLKDNLYSDLNNGNEMLHRLQRDIFREPKVKTYPTPEGMTGTMVRADDTYRNTGSMGILNLILEKKDAILKESKGE
ncbi:hypothetical protein ACHAL6_00415 [Proteiniclasticum sp. C24MP]|uniref:hypothetical protein n=1 Tax=Proteiniclasticum sp. C24MP TaxID=3374101 RepID=UPI0037541736